MDFDEPVKENGRLSQDDALQPQMNCESDAMDSGIPFTSCTVSHSSQLDQSRPTDFLGAPATDESSSVTIARLKARHDLHLPPFRSFLIAAPPPHLLLTPPDDADPHYWKPLTHFSKFHLSKRPLLPHPTSMSSREDTSSHKPLEERPTSESDATTPPVQPPQSQPPTSGCLNPQPEDNAPAASNIPNFSRDEESTWLQEAVEVVCKPSMQNSDECSS